MDSLGDDEMCDLETLEALLDEDDVDVCDPQASKRSNERREDKQSTELAEFLNAASDDSDDDHDGDAHAMHKSTASMTSVKKPAQSHSKSPLLKACVKEDQTSVFTNVKGINLKEESDRLSSPGVPQPSHPSETGSSTEAIMKEMARMQKQMEELQKLLQCKQLKEENEKEKKTGVNEMRSVKKEFDDEDKRETKCKQAEKINERTNERTGVTKTFRHSNEETKVSVASSDFKTKVRLMADDEEGNLFFGNDEISVSSKPEKKKFFSSSSNGSLISISDNGKTRAGINQSSTSGNSKMDVAHSSTSSLALFGPDNSDSDWEDMDGESKSNLSEEGMNLKRLLKSKEKSRTAHSSKIDTDRLSENSSYEGPVRKVKEEIEKKKNIANDKHSLKCATSSTEQSKAGSQKASDLEKVVTEDFSRIRIVNPLISSSVMKMRMEGRKLVSISRIHLKLNTPDLQGDWVTIGVVVSKTSAKASSSGKPYSIWRLSDLHDLEHTASFFLFGQVHGNHWKLDVGSVIGLLNPNIMESTEKGKGEPAFTIKNPNQLMVIGRSKDLGWCVGFTKKGNKCSQFVNKRQGDFCSYHVQAEYKKTSAQRLEFHGSVHGVRPKSFEKKIFSKNSSYIYGGNTYVPNNNTAKSKNAVTLSKLQQKVSAGKKKISTFSIQDIKPSSDSNPNIESGKSQADDNIFMDMISVPSPGAMNLVAHLKKNQNEASRHSARSRTGANMQSITAGDLLKEHKRTMGMRKPAKPKASDLLLSSSQTEMFERKESCNSSPNSTRARFNPLREKPMLGKGLSNGQDINLTVTGRTLSLTDKSKLKAIHMLQKKGGLSKEDPNAVRKVKGDKEKQNINKRVREDSQTQGGDESSEASGLASSREPKAKKSKLLGNVDLNSEEVKRILKAKSKHMGALAEKEAEREEVYFEGLEKKEMLEEKLKSVTSIEINVYTCKQCHYTAQSALDQCKKDQHTIVKSKAKKRFFACKKCKERTTSINGLFPTEPCRKCNSLCYEKTSMYKERKGPVLDSEVLCHRGDEVKFLTSMEQKVFMNTVMD